MTTSAPVPSTCYQIICDAMVDAGKLGQGREPNSEQLAENMRRLNKYVNYLQTQGAILWVQEDLSLQAPTLQANVSLYPIGVGGVTLVPALSPVAKPRRIIEAYFIDSTASNNRRPINIVSRNEWDSYSTTTQPGTIVSIYPDKQLNTINCNLWMTPSAQQATGFLHLIVDLQIPNFAQLTDNMFFPSEWALTLEWGLADQISTGMPQEVVDRCATKSVLYESALLNWDVEDASTRFQPDPQGQFSGRRVGRY
jgi:hypothetical protein